MKILMIGGGSGGPVSPLLAVANKIKETHPTAKFLFVGTKNGPEKMMAQGMKIPFVAIASGKFRRYFSWKNFISPFFVFTGFFQSLKILKTFRPDCILGAGSFVQVPLTWAAWVLKIPVVLHQQDIVPGLANKLSELTAKKITVTFETSIRDFSNNLGFFYKRQSEKIMLTGNPFREELKEGDRERALKKFGFSGALPTLLVLGGGTGAEFINTLITDSLPELCKTVQIIHSTGKGKFLSKKNNNYFATEFLNTQDLADAYELAEIVISRAGLATITELANLKKVSIIVPMPSSHQEYNVAFLLSQHACIGLTQKRLNSKNLVALIKKLIFNYDVQEMLKDNIGKIMPKNAAKKIADIVINLAEK